MWYHGFQTQDYTLTVSTLVRARPTRCVGGIRPPRDPRGAGVVVRQPLRDRWVVAVDVVVYEAVEEHLPVLIGHLLVGGPLDPNLRPLPDLLRASRPSCQWVGLGS